MTLIANGSATPETVASKINMDQLLSKAEPRGPAALIGPDAGAVLALACHVLMVQSGFQSTLPAGGDNPSNKWAPHPNWMKEFKDEWKFNYTMPGKRNTLVLHCSLQRSSGRFLVHTVELNNPVNDHLLGLSLPKYVADESLLRRPSWAGVVQNADAMAAMMRQHVMEPLVDGAIDVPSGEADWLTDKAAGRQGRPDSWWTWTTGGAGGSGSYVVPAVLLTGLAISGVAAYVLMRQRQRLRHS